jgi:hypothetical protein
MTYQSLLRPHVGQLCKCLPISAIGMWELVVPASEPEANARLAAVGEDCACLVKEGEGPLSGLTEVIPFARLATFIPGKPTIESRPRKGRTR